MKASCSLRFSLGAHFTHFPHYFPEVRRKQFEQSLLFSKDPLFGFRLAGTRGINTANACTFTTLSPYFSALIRLLLTRQERAGAIDHRSLKPNLCSRSRPRFCVVFRTFHSFAVPRLNLIFVHIRAAAVSQQRRPPCTALFGQMGRCAEWPDSLCVSSGGWVCVWGVGGGGHKHNVVCLTPIVCTQSLPAHHLTGACSEGDVGV